MQKKWISLFAALCLCLNVLSPLAGAVGEGVDFVLTNLQTEYRTDPIGLDVASPRLSWQMQSEERGVKQESYRITAATSVQKLENGVYDAWDSGTVKSDCSTGIAYGGQALQAKTRYFWRVTVKDKSGNSVTSTTAYFETGLMGSGWGKAVWITAGKGAPDADTKAEREITGGATDHTEDSVAPMLRREFTAGNGSITSARLYVTAAGLYEVYLNGQPVTDSVLNPGRSDYSKKLYYQVYDVTEKIQSGENAIGAVLGHGWFRTKWNNYGTTLGLLARLEITYADGGTQTVVTDGSWKTFCDGPLRYEDIYNGVTYDATREIDGWAESGLDDSAWTAAQTTTASALNVVATPVYTPTQETKTNRVFEVREILHSVENTYVYDFGQNMSGVPYLVIRGQKGQRLKIRYGEEINDRLSNKDGENGTVYQGTFGSAQQTDYFTCSGGEDIFCPTMTSHGFRYMEVSSMNFDLPTRTELETLIPEVKACARYTGMETTSTFESSNEKINRLYQNAFWSGASDFVNTPTDSAANGERQGWSGDAQIFARTASYFYNCMTFYEKYVSDLRLGQHPNGAYPEVAPAPTWTNQNAKNGWGDAGVIIPWTMYLQYGDTRILEENYAAMSKWIDCLMNQSENYVRTVVQAYGDWLSLENTPYEVTENAYTAYAAHLMMKIAEILGKTEDVTKFETIYKGYREQWNLLCTDGNGKTNCDTQTSYVLGLEYELFDESVRETAAARLAELVVNNGYRLKTGFMGVKLLNKVLTDYGYSAVAYRLLEQEQYPSWLYLVNAGLTTIPEKWDALTDNGDGTYKIVFNQNHFNNGSVFEWVYRYVLGIDTDETVGGYRKIVLHPTPGGTFDYVKGSLDSRYGMISSGWSYDGNDLVYEVTVPANTTAALTLPLGSGTEVLEGSVSAGKAQGVTLVSRDFSAATYTLGSGTYRFTVKNYKGGAGAKYLNIRGANIRLATEESSAGLRFATVVNKNEFYTAHGGERVYSYSEDSNLRFGTLIIPEKLLKTGSDVVTAFKSGDSNVLDVPAQRVYAQDDQTLTYTAVLTGIPQSDYATVLQAAAYLRYRENAESDWTYIFTDSVCRSYYGVASGVLERDFLPLKNLTESDLETIKALQAIVDAVEKDLWLGGDIWY